MAQVPVFVVVKGEEDIAKLTHAIDVANQKSTAAASSAGKFSSVLSGIGAGLGVAGVLGVANAVSTFTSVMGDAVAGAMEDQRSIAALGVTLRDNIPAWDGNTSAIERAIAERMKFGFADDALRSSLSTIVAVTRDTTRALELQTLAMNIARFRGIDLASASDMVAKAAGGSLKALNAAIPATRGAANAQDALRIATEATAGQMQAYADTAVGKMESANVAIDESLERIGYIVLPVVADAATVAAGAVDILATAVEGLMLPVEAATAAADRHAVAATDAAYAGSAWTAQVNALLAPAAAAANAIDTLAIETKYAAINAAEGIPGLNAFEGAANGVGSAAGWAAGQVNALNSAMNSGKGAIANVSAGFRSANLTITDLATANDKAGASQRRINAELNKVPAHAGGASRAMRDYSSAVERAFDAMRTKVYRVIDAIHQKNLQAIDDARDTANKLLDSQIAGLNKEVDEAQKALDKKRDAQRKADLELAVAQAQTAEERAQAQAQLDDFLAQQRIDQMREENQTKIDALEAQKDVNNQNAEDAKKAEDARYKAQKAEFDKELKELEAHLKAKKITWDKANQEILDLLKASGLDFESVGKTMGTKYASGYTKGVNSAIKSIAAAVAKLLGLDEATIRGLSGGSGSAAETNTATGATAASGAATAQPASAAIATSSAAPSGSKTGNTYNFSLAINAGAFTGTDADAKRFAQAMWQAFKDETERRARVWPEQSDWTKVMDHVA